MHDELSPPGQRVVPRTVLASAVQKFPSLRIRPGHRTGGTERSPGSEQHVVQYRGLDFDSPDLKHRVSVFECLRSVPAARPPSCTFPGEGTKQEGTARCSDTYRTFPKDFYVSLRADQNGAPSDGLNSWPNMHGGTPPSRPERCTPYSPRQCRSCSPMHKKL